MSLCVFSKSVLCSCAPSSRHSHLCQAIVQLVKTKSVFLGLLVVLVCHSLYILMHNFNGDGKKKKKRERERERDVLPM